MEAIMNSDQVKGRAKTVKGIVKEKVGEILDDKDLKNKGSAEKNAGKVQSAYGDLKNDIAKK